ncbi:TATA box-binding protein-like 2 [Anopheles arabiensis]|uniref:TATA box-binding protein-like 1 n=1 Tax=Anopheles arabiensis TaxID=7173 RepID=A0A182I3D9_ANOAR|nr:TATA box-binding protein-like 2 [Anopheles arabiensis]
MVGTSSFISNAISTSSAPNGISGTSSSSSTNINTAGSGTAFRNGISVGGKATVLGVNSATGHNEVVSGANGFHLRQHPQQQQQQQQQSSTSGVVRLAKGSTSSVISLPSDHQYHQSIAGGMINHSSLMFATTTTTNHQQQLSVLSNASPVGDGAIGEKKAGAKIGDSTSLTTTTTGNSSSIILASNTTTIITSSSSSTTTSSSSSSGTTTNNSTTITTNTPTESDPTGADTELSLETKETSPDNEPQEEQPEIDIVINNVVCSFSVRCHLNLHDIARHGHNVEFRREHGMVTMKLRRPYTTASIWSSGKITCTGATSEHQAKIAARRYSRCLQKLGFNVRFRNFRIVNVLGTCSMPFGIMIVNFSEKYKKDASYEPELHPGVTYKLYSPKATLKIFSTGSITVTAASVAFVQAAIEQIFPLVYEFRKKRTPIEKQAMAKQQPPPDFDPHDVDHLIEEDREGALAEAEEGLTYWNGTADEPTMQQPEEEQPDDELETFGDDEDVRTRNNTKAIHKINSIRQNGKKRRMRQLRPSGRAVNDGDSMSDDDLCVSDYE